MRPEKIDTIDPYKHFSVPSRELCAPLPPAVRRHNCVRGQEVLS